MASVESEPGRMMAVKPKKSGNPRHNAFPNPRKGIPVYGGQTDDEARRNYANAVISPEVAAYRIVGATEAKSGLGEQLDTPAVLETLRGQAETVNRGEMVQVEAMLINQATALQSIFARLAERGMGCDSAVPFEVNMRIALRAQSQCRAALETLAAIKNPSSVAFVRQANIAHGPQQVNNGPGPGGPSRAREIEFTPNKLLEASNGERLDSGTACAAGRTNQELETMGAIHGTANAGGQAKG